MKHLSVNLIEAKELVVDALIAGLVPFLHSSPGLGKSSLANQIAKEYNLYPIDCRLTQMDTSDFNGLIFKNSTSTKSSYLPIDYFPLENDPIPNGYAGWLIILDELSSAPLSIQAASYKLILDRMIGNTKLHPKVKMIACGNLMTDKAIVNRQSTAMQSRMLHLVVHSDLNVSIKYFQSVNVDSRIISFLQFKPGLLHYFDPNHSDLTFPCPRTWEFLNKLLKGWNNPTEIAYNKLPLIAGVIGQGTAREFYTFSEIYKELPDRDSILNKPETTVVPNEPSSLYAITGMLADMVTDITLGKVLIYLARLPIEFQTITLQAVVRKNPDYLSHPAITPWIIQLAKYL